MADAGYPTQGEQRAWRRERRHSAEKGGPSASRKAQFIRFSTHQEKAGRDWSRGEQFNEGRDLFSIVLQTRDLKRHREDEAVRPHSGRRLVPLSRTWQQGYARTWKRVNEQRHACPGRRAGKESADDCERLAPPRGRDRDAAQTENRVIAGDPPAPRRPVLLPRG